MKTSLRGEKMVVNLKVKLDFVTTKFFDDWDFWTFIRTCDSWARCPSDEDWLLSVVEYWTLKWPSIVQLDNNHDYLRWGDGTIPLQSGCVPNLGFNREAVQLYRPRTELHTNSGPAVMVELVLSKAWKQVALAYARFPYENHWGNKHRGDYKARMLGVSTGSDLYYLATVVRKSL